MTAYFFTPPASLKERGSSRMGEVDNKIKIQAIIANG
jgi:hypothetical protein